MRKTKIVGTLGPASSSPEVLERLVRAGLDVARLNFSHGGFDAHRATFEAVRAASKRVGRPVAVLGDLCGPKIRLGAVAGGEAELREGSEVLLRFDDDGDEGTAELLFHSYKELANDVKPGDRVLINDGRVGLRVEDTDGRTVRARVEVGGPVASRKGINLPGVALSTPSLTEHDRRCLAFGRELGVDYFALSFVRRAADVAEARALAGSTPVIAKIEKPEALDDLPAILAEADGAMVARGDLGVEIGHEKVPLVQKRLIALMSEHAKPVITATEMLDSMIRSPSPTRAEVSDVANAVIDGTDAVMLSGETAVGRYPVEAVQVMASIIGEIERSGHLHTKDDEPQFAERSFSRVIADAACTAARDHGLDAIAVFSETGRTARLVSTYRPRVNVIAFSRSPATVRRMALLWGVHPIATGGHAGSVTHGVDLAQRELLRHGLAKPGDRIAVTFGGGPEDAPIQTDVLKLAVVRDPGEG